MITIKIASGTGAEIEQWELDEYIKYLEMADRNIQCRKEMMEDKRWARFAIFCNTGKFPKHTDTGVTNK